MSGSPLLKRLYGTSLSHGDTLMAEYLYLYRGGARPSSADDSQQVMQRWMAWFKELTATGNLKDGGQPLEGEGRVVNGTGGTITDGPYAEAKDLVGGYTLIEAPTIERAAELARGCPLLQRGGAVEVRPVMKIDM